MSLLPSVDATSLQAATTLVIHQRNKSIPLVHQNHPTWSVSWKRLTFKAIPMSD